MTGKKSDEVLGKLGKVADSLETATSQLTGVVTQQQLDVARERISKCEADIQSLYKQTEVFTTNKNEQLSELYDTCQSMKVESASLEKDYTGLRSLTLSSFVLSIVSLIGVILCASKLQ